jgi:hypothetical protein
MGAEFVMSSVYTNAIFGVFTSTFFEEIGFPLGGGGHTMNMRLLERGYEAISLELDVLTHETHVHAEEANRDTSS